jgi:hypothetical protein
LSRESKKLARKIAAGIAYKVLGKPFVNAEEVEELADVLNRGK